MASTNPTSYYRDVADYTGCVQQISQELTGLTVWHYDFWYSQHCSDFYYAKAGKMAAFRQSRYKSSSDPVIMDSYIRLVFRWTSRLYRLRKLLKIEATYKRFYKSKSAALSASIERGYGRALDKRLFLAMELKSTAQELVTFIPQLRRARAGYTWFSKQMHDFNPERNRVDGPSETGKAMATMEHFHVLLSRFEKETYQPETTSLPDLSSSIAARSETENLSSGRSPSDNGRPWARIDALAEQIKLRVRGSFVPPDNKVAAAGAGFIDGLREADIIPKTETLASQYADFTQHFQRMIRADRITTTREHWRKATLIALGLLT